MGAIDQKTIERFKEKAALVSIEISEVKNLTEAMDQAAEICAAARPARLVTASQRQPQPAENILAAPALNDADFKALSEAGGQRKLRVINNGLRANLSGVEAAFTIADMGIADTATIVLNSLSEETRLATMVCETHIVALPKSKIFMDSYQVEDHLRELLNENAMYAAFISGPSRTADIERVLTIGVHGPVAMRVLLMDEEA